MQRELQHWFIGQPKCVLASRPTAGRWARTRAARAARAATSAAACNVLRCNLRRARSPDALRNPARVAPLQWSVGCLVLIPSAS
eukprot:11199885-Alexandrium_andersonii.AAC.1